MTQSTDDKEKFAVMNDSSRKKGQKGKRSEAEALKKCRNGEEMSERELTIVLEIGVFDRPLVFASDVNLHHDAARRSQTRWRLCCI